MKKKPCLLIIFSLCLIFGMVLVNCDGDDDNGSPTGSGTTGEILADQDVTVPPDGGFSPEIPIFVDKEQTIRITLTASNTSMQPYGYLDYPGGGGDYYPPLQTAQNGTNSIEVTLDQIGTYQFLVLDGANIGGTVHVKIEVL